jgi:hypothetical protein
VANVAVVAGEDALQVYDVSEPMKPVRVATHRTLSMRPLHVAVSAEKAYVTDARNGLLEVDLLIPASPRLVGATRLRIRRAPWPLKILSSSL